MKIIHIITKAERGGAQVHVLGLIRYQLEQGHDVQLLCGTEGFLTEMARSAGARVTLCGEIIHPVRPLHDFLAIFKLRQRLRRLTPDIAHAHSSKAGMLVRIACWFERVPCVFTAHGWAFSEGTPVSRRILGQATEKLIARLGQPIITVSEYDRQLAIAKKVAKPEQLITIHNGMPDAPATSREKQNNDIKTLIMVARFANQKNPELLIKSMPLLPKKVQCILVGDGPNLRRCQLLAKQLGIESQINFTGNSDCIPELLNSASIFVLLTHYEGLPLTIIEAMRARLPVIASNVGGISEQIQDGVTGYLVKRDAKPAEVAAICQRLLDNPANLEVMGRAGRRHYQNHFSEEIMMNKIGVLYDQTIKTSV